MRRCGITRTATAEESRPSVVRRQTLRRYVTGTDIEALGLASLDVVQESLKLLRSPLDATPDISRHAVARPLELRRMVSANGSEQLHYVHGRILEIILPHMQLALTHIRTSSSPQVLVLAASRSATQVSTSISISYIRLTLQGAKSYCCKEVFRPFTNCAWYKKETRLRPDWECEPSCPAGYMKLGIQRGDCTSGEQAYCCRGDSSDPPPAPPKSAKVQEFEDALEL